MLVDSQFYSFLFALLGGSYNSAEKKKAADGGSETLGWPRLFPAAPFLPRIAGKQPRAGMSRALKSGRLKTS